MFAVQNVLVLGLVSFGKRGILMQQLSTGTGVVQRLSAWILSTVKHINRYSPSLPPLSSSICLFISPSFRCPFRCPQRLLLQPSPHADGRSEGFVFSNCVCVSVCVCVYVVCKPSSPPIWVLLPSSACREEPLSTPPTLTAQCPDESLLFDGRISPPHTHTLPRSLGLPVRPPGGVDRGLSTPRLTNRRQAPRTQRAIDGCRCLIRRHTPGPVT